MPTTTLADICERYACDRVIDFLRVDVEGREAEVLLGANLSRWRPRVIATEVVSGSEHRPPTHPKCRVLLEFAGQVAVLFDGLNRYYIRSEEATLLFHKLSAAAEVLDKPVRYRHLPLYGRSMLIGSLSGVWARVRVRLHRWTSSSL